MADFEDDGRFAASGGSTRHDERTGTGWGFDSGDFGRFDDLEPSRQRPGVGAAGRSDRRADVAAREGRVGSVARVGRFAPTPSGRMHIGNVYAMLGAWLSAHAGEAGGSGGADGPDGVADGDGAPDAKRDFDVPLRSSVPGSPATTGVSRDLGGRMLLRIEDVDRPRAVPDADRWIMDDLAWLGLDWFGEPVYQSQRTELYDDALRSLEKVTVGDVLEAFTGQERSTGDDTGRFRDDGYDIPLVYPCFCSRADVRAASAPQEGDRFLVYPGTCRTLLVSNPAEVRARVSAGRRHSLRVAVPQACAGSAHAPDDSRCAHGFDLSFDDVVFGPQHFDLGREVGDTVIRRSDGLFSYQLAVVVDDLMMGVNDIVRGRDLLRSTALQIWLRNALLVAGFVPGDAGSSQGVGLGNRASSGSRKVPNVDGNDFGTDCAVMGPENPRTGPRRQYRDCIAGESTRNAAPLSQSRLAAAANPRYAHLPLIDDSSGIRLAKRKRSLDLGRLRADGVQPEEVIGYCAWLLGLRAEPKQREPVPMTANEALQCFTWAAVRTDVSDRRLPEPR